MTGDAGLITLEGITKVYYTDELETHALSDVHLQIAQGEFVAVSGATFCRCLPLT